MGMYLVDPMKRQLITRILAVADMLLGILGILVQTYQIWDSYYVVLMFSKEEEIIERQDLVSEERYIRESYRLQKIPVSLFLLISATVFSVKFLQIFMGFTLLVTTFGRNLLRSIRVAEWWLKVSIFLMLALTFKLTAMVAASIAKLFIPHWTELTLTVIEMVIRIFSFYWVSKYIDFLTWHAEFELNVCSLVSRC